MRTVCSSAWRLSAIVSLAVAAAAGLVLVWRFDPTQVGFFPPCLFRKLTGLQCPGCGSTRALHHLLHGDVAGAFRLNPMLFAAVPFAGAWRSRWILRPAVGWTALVVTLAWWVVRNTPLWPW